jgi:hypothetical protein
MRRNRASNAAGAFLASFNKRVPPAPHSLQKKQKYGQKKLDKTVQICYLILNKTYSY